MIVRAISTFIRSHPYAQCPGGGDTPQALVGLRIGAGWSSEVRKRLPSCDTYTHLRENLGPVATAAYQTTVGVRPSSLNQRGDDGKPLKIDSCHAYGASRALVKSRDPNTIGGHCRQRPTKASAFHGYRCRKRQCDSHERCLAQNARLGNSLQSAPYGRRRAPVVARCRSSASGGLIAGNQNTPRARPAASPAPISAQRARSSLPIVFGARTRSGVCAWVQIIRPGDTFRSRHPVAIRSI